MIYLYESSKTGAVLASDLHRSHMKILESVNEPYASWRYRLTYPASGASFKYVREVIAR